MKHKSLAFLAVLLLVCVASAQEPAAAPVDPLEAQRQKVADQIAAAKKAVEAASADGAKPPQTLQQKLELIEQINLTMGQHADLREHREELDKSKADLTVKLERLRSDDVDEEKPYSFLLLDSLRDELNAEQNKQDSGAALLAAAQANLDQAAQQKEEANQAQLQAESKLDRAEEGAGKAPLSLAVRQAELNHRLADAVHAQRRTALENEKVAQALAELNRTFLKEKVDLIAAEVVFNEEDLQSQLREIEKKEIQLSRAKEQAEEYRKYYQQRFTDARTRRDQAADVDTGLVELVQQWDIARKMSRGEVALLGKRLARLATRKEIWRHRHDLARRVLDRATLIEWQEDAGDLIEELDLAEIAANTELTDLRTDMVTVEVKLESAEEAAASVRQSLAQQRRFLRQHISAYDAELASIDVQRRTAQKLLDQIEAQLGGFSFRGLLGDIWQMVVKGWNYSIEVGEPDAEGKRTKISIGKMVAGLVLLFLGFFFSRLISRFFGRFVLRRTRLNNDASQALQSVLFYVLLLFFALIALNLVNVPLTVFTVLGGAVAIGVGFGAQNLINNFISGWILIAERPVRIGDLVEIEGVTGLVRSVGARCTRIRRPDGIDLLVPNSHLLENNVVNWTLSDTHIRTFVRVGVIYGSPTDQVARLIMRVVTRNDKVLAHPKPILIFRDFGNDSLVFDIFFWIQATAEMDLWQAESEIRFEIDQVFRAAGIVIAFPQRDVHLYPHEPVEVRMVEAEPEERRDAKPTFRQHREHVSLLREIELFHSLDDDEVDSLAHALVEHEFDAEEDVVRQGDEGASLFILVHGLLEVKVREVDRERTVAQLIPGEFFGEISLLTGEARTATVTTVTHSRIFELCHDCLTPIVQQRGEVADTLIRALAQRRKKAQRFVQEAEPYPDVPESGFVGEMRRRINRFFGLRDEHDG